MHQIRIISGDVYPAARVANSLCYMRSVPVHHGIAAMRNLE